MFEQSLLLPDSVAKKSGAFAASLTAQILFTGVLVVMPLAVQQVAPLVKVAVPLAMPLLTPPPPPVPLLETQKQAVPYRRARLTIDWLRAPIIVPTTPPDRQMIDEPAPELGPRVVGGPTAGLVNDGGISQIVKVLPPPPQPPPPVVTRTDPTPVRVSGGVMAAQLIKKVVPIYPPLARQARVSGTVRLEGIISKDGTIRNLQVLSGHPLLVSAALDAVRQWVYRPTLLGGSPVEVIAPIDVVFTLN